MIVGLYGPSRAGKDTVALVLVRHHGFEQRNMATPIREVLVKINPPVELNEDGYTFLAEAVEELGWNGVKKWYPQTVEWMISLGQGMRDVDPGIWLNACVGKPFTDLVIADVRQPNEAEFILNQGGELWKVERAGSQIRGMDGILDDWDFAEHIDNNGTIEELVETVEMIMEGRQ